MHPGAFPILPTLTIGIYSNEMTELIILLGYGLDQ